MVIVCGEVNCGGHGSGAHDDGKEDKVILDIKELIIIDLK